MGGLFKPSKQSGNFSIKKTVNQGLGDGSVGKVLAMEA